MAMVFDLDTERDTRFDGVGDPVDAAFELIHEHISGLEPRAALARIRRYQAQLCALETSVVATVNRQSGSDREAKRLLNDGRSSKRAIARAARRAEAAAKNTALIDKLAAGDLSEEQLDVIAETSAKTDGAAATDAGFIDAVADVDPDQAQNVATRFINDHTDPDGLQSEHDRQRRDRKASKYVSKKDGLATIALGSDATVGAAMWAAIKQRAGELYDADGGRDVVTGLHPRTHNQRLLDAAYELICGVTTTPTGTRHQPRNGIRGTGRPQIFVGLTLDKYLGRPGAAMATQIGHGIIPDSVLAEYLEHADIIGALYDRHGQPLWLARTRRHASLMQRYALIARDQACVRCGADHAQCEVHHLMPWNAPGQGETNLDQLALLCGSCHRQLHADNHTLFQDASRVWRTRPATPNETPPTRTPNYPQRE